MSQLDPSDVSATASQPAAVIAAHLARVQEVQATMDHPSSPSPEPGERERAGRHETRHMSHHRVTRQALLTLVTAMTVALYNPPEPLLPPILV